MTELQLDWDRMGQPQFDRVVEALVHRLYDDFAEVRAVNGRGGDGGRDILVQVGHESHIYQLKYMPEGFSGGHKGRRQQIARSFKRAMAHKPTAWKFVVPCTLTIEEREFVDALGDKYDVRIGVLDRAQLDARFAIHSDLVDYFTRDQARAAAKDYGREKALLTAGLPDLTERLGALGRVVAGSDPDWTVDFALQEGVALYGLRAKHPRAHLTSPITLTLDNVFGPQHRTTELAWQATQGFGASNAVVLTPDIVKRLTITGPDWIAGTSDHVEVSWTPLASEPRKGALVSLRLLDADDKLLSSHEGEVTWLNTGTVGYALEGKFYGVVELQLLFPKEIEGTGKVNVSFDVAGTTPMQMRQCLALNRDLHHCDRADILIDGEPLAKVHVNHHVADGEQASEDFADLELLAEDLEVIQRHCNTYFPVPPTVRGGERLAIRVTRLILEGHCVLAPEMQRLRATLNGSYGPGLRKMLTDGTCMIRSDHDNFRLKIGHRELHIGKVTYYHPQVTVLNAAEHLTALESGKGAGRQIEVAPVDECSFRVFMPEKWSDPSAPLAPRPWGLTGLEELEEIRAQQAGVDLATLRGTTA